MDEKILEHLSSKLEDRKRQLTEYLCEGTAKDYAEYKALCGEIRGLLAAQVEASDLVRKLKELEDE